MRITHEQFEAQLAFNSAAVDLLQHFRFRDLPPVVAELHERAWLAAVLLLEASRRADQQQR